LLLGSDISTFWPVVLSVARSVEASNSCSVYSKISEAQATTFGFSWSFSDAEGSQAIHTATHTATVALPSPIVTSCHRVIMGAGASSSRSGGRTWSSFWWYDV